MSREIDPRAGWHAIARASLANANGAIFYRGPSLIDGQPIVAVATGLTVGSSNGKTGAMVQTYILADNGESPADNVRSGADVSICGDCPHRLNPATGKRACYVTLAHGPRSVSVSINRGRYVDATEGVNARAFWEMLRGRALRLGTYGDPLALPLHVWEPMLRAASSWTGYTHQWRRAENADAGAIVMASVDSEQEAREATAQGLRYFRVRARGAPLIEGEIECPSTRGVRCEDCGLCSGNATRAKSISIEAHGAGAGAFELVQLRR